MSRKAGKTPTPWRVESDGDKGRETVYVVTDDPEERYGDRICDMLKGSKQQRLRNAHAIAKSVNYHDRLVEVVRDLADAAHGVHDLRDDAMPDMMDKVAEAEELLAKLGDK